MPVRESITVLRRRAWRASLRVRSPRVAVRFAWGLARGVEHERPIFAVGVPRSGTTTVRSLLAASSAICAAPFEGHVVWNAFQHPRRSGWDEGARVGAGRLRRGERRFASAYFYAYCGGHRFVDKTPANALRIPHVLEVFPDATFVAVRRSPVEVINSIIDVWRRSDSRYLSYRVPAALDIPGHAFRRSWRLALIPGWRQFAAAPIPEIAFAQWERVSAAIEEGRSAVPPRQWVDLYIEDLHERAEETLVELCAGLGIPFEPALTQRLAELHLRPLNPTAEGTQGGWRERNRAEVEALLPRIAAAAPAYGYSVDPDSGEVAMSRAGSAHLAAR